MTIKIKCGISVGAYRSRKFICSIFYHNGEFIVFIPNLMFV